MSTPDDIRLLYCTCPDAGIAEVIARELVTSRLAACVNIVPGLRSIYLWEAAIQDDAEVLLMIKSKASRIDAITQCIRQHHPYELPEVIAVPIVAGLDAYLDWVRSSTH